VAVGDVTGEGRTDLVLGAGPGGAPRVLVVDGRSVLSAGPAAALAAPVADFFAGADDSRAGAAVAVTDLNRDGVADVVAAPASGDRSRVTGYLITDLVRHGRPLEEVTVDDLFGDVGGVYVG
jgi:hypothetical protein